MTAHHLDPATLLSYAAGSLPLGLAVVAAAHLERCPTCRAQLRQAEHLGGLLLDAAPDRPTFSTTPAAASPTTSHVTSDGARARMLALINGPAGATRAVAARAPVANTPPPPRASDDNQLPSALQPYFGAGYAALRWRWLAPGVHRILAPLPAAQGRLMLLRIQPGRQLPEHAHDGSEITLVLQGAYQDQLGRFGPGDVADLDESIEHQPVASGPSPCICVAATDAPLRFRGLLPRLLQPLVGA